MPPGVVRPAQATQARAAQADGARLADDLQLQASRDAAEISALRAQLVQTEVRTLRTSPCCAASSSPTPFTCSDVHSQELKSQLAAAKRAGDGAELLSKERSAMAAAKALADGEVRVCHPLNHSFGFP